MKDSGFRIHIETNVYIWVRVILYRLGFRDRAVFVFAGMNLLRNDFALCVEKNMVSSFVLFMKLADFRLSFLPRTLSLYAFRNRARQ